MITVIASVLAIWGLLFGSAYLSRTVLRWTRLQAVATVAGTYVVLAVIALTYFGWTANGLTAVSGMVLPTAFSIVLACLLPDAPDSAQAGQGPQ
jgi:hypothetical protein